MPTTTPTPKEVERHYDVALTLIGGPPDGGAYEPRRVRLRYSEAEARELDPTSERALAQAIRRAEVLERREFESTSDSAAFEGTAIFARESLVDYLPRSRPRSRNNRRVR